MLRFFAAFMVVLYHAPALYERAGGTIDFKPFVSFGFAGVDIFFVISGFIMWVTTKRRSGINDALNFIYKRSTRIYLTLWIVLGLYAVYFMQFAPSRLANVDFLKSFLLIPQDIKTNLLGVTWTLSYEMYFYILFAFALAFGGRKWIPGVGLIALAVFIAGRSGISVPFSTVTTGAPIAEFFAGCAVGYAYERDLIKRPAAWLIAGTLILAAAMIYAGINLPQPLEYGSYKDFRVAVLLPMAVCFVAGSAALDKIYSPPQWTVTMGDASYGIYLWHAPLFVVWFDFVRDRNLSDLQLLSSLALCIAFILWLSEISMRLIERPILDALYGKSRHSLSGAGRATTTEPLSKFRHHSRIGQKQDP